MSSMEMLTMVKNSSQFTSCLPLDKWLSDVKLRMSFFGVILNVRDYDVTVRQLAEHEIITVDEKFRNFS